MVLRGNQNFVMGKNQALAHKKSSGTQDESTTIQPDTSMI